jgi:hypothetical protein
MILKNSFLTLNKLWKQRQKLFTQLSYNITVGILYERDFENKQRLENQLEILADDIK